MNKQKCIFLILIIAFCFLISHQLSAQIPIDISSLLITTTGATYVDAQCKATGDLPYGLPSKIFLVVHDSKTSQIDTSAPVFIDSLITRIIVRLHIGNLKPNYSYFLQAVCMDTNGNNVKIIPQNWADYPFTTPDTVRTDLAENTTITQPSVFPNPMHEKAKLVLSENKAGTFILYDLQGRIVHLVRTLSGSIEINRCGLPKGIYLYQIESNSHRYTGKLVMD